MDRNPKPEKRGDESKETLTIAVWGFLDPTGTPAAPELDEVLSTERVTRQSTTIDLQRSFVRRLQILQDVL